MIPEKPLNDFLIFLLAEKRYSKHTISSYRIDIEQFFKFCNTDNIENIDRSMMRSWLQHRKDNNYEATSTRRSISALRSFFKYLVKHSDIKVSSDFNFIRPKTSNWLPRDLDHNIILKMVESVPLLYSSEDAASWMIARDQAIIMLLYGTGLRISEALSVKKTDLNNGRDFLIITGKRSKQRIVPILPAVREYIEKYLATCPFGIIPDKGIFLSNKGDKYYPRAVQLTIEKLRKLLHLPNFVTPHTMRHSCASNIINNGGNIRQVQQLLGHQNLETTQIYTSVSNVQISKAYREAFEKVGANIKD